MAAESLSFSSKIFKIDTVQMGDRSEQIVKGGRHLFPLLPKAFAGVKQIGVIGWGSQGPAQAQNLRDSLEGTGISVKVGLRGGSDVDGAGARRRLHRGERHARRDVRGRARVGHRAPADLPTPRRRSSTAAVFEALRPGATLGLSHGFLLGHLNNVGAKFPANINVIAVCPKGMGPSVRRLYVQGKEVNGAGINASFAVQQDIDGRATDYALGWSVALGSPYTFQTTLESEFKSDIYGERGILLGAVHGIIESLYRRYVSQGMSQGGRVPELGRVDHRPHLHDHLQARHPRRLRRARRRRQGGVREGLRRRPTGGREVLAEIYDEVSSGNEIRGVVLAGDRLKKHPMGKIDGTETWKVGAGVRAKRDEDEDPAQPVHRRRLHRDDDGADRHPAREGPPVLRGGQRVGDRVGRFAEPLHARARRRLHGRQLLDDGAPRLAQVGARASTTCSRSWRTWPSTRARTGKRRATRLIDAFKRNVIHKVLKVCAELRPSVDISVS